MKRRPPIIFWDPPHETIRILIKGLAPGVLRENQGWFVIRSACEWIDGTQDEVDAAGDGEVGVSCKETLAGQVDCVQRRGAARLHAQRQTVETETKRDPRRSGADFVTEEDAEEVRLPLLVCTLGLEDDSFVVLLPLPDEDARVRVPETQWIDSRILQTLPGHFEEEALLRVKERCFPWADPKELCVKLVSRALEEPSLHVLPSRKSEIIAIRAERTNCIPTLGKETPVLRRAVRTRKTTTHPHNRNFSTEIFGGNWRIHCQT